MVYLADDEVEMFAEIFGNTMTYNGKKYKIVRVTADGYYINELK